MAAVFLLAACDSTSPTEPPGASATEKARAAHPGETNVASNAATASAGLEATEEAGAPAQPREISVQEEGIPPQGSPLSADQARRLLTGTIMFTPGAIESSNVPVEPGAPLDIGQELQVKWNTTWWAATVLGIEPDGRVKIRYFGWSKVHDELKTRAELQVDRKARMHALEKSYVRDGW